jgi:hypothetical protein
MRMRAPHDLFEILQAHVGVDPGAFHTRVANDRLDVTEIGVVSEQVRRHAHASNGMLLRTLRGAVESLAIPIDASGCPRPPLPGPPPPLSSRQRYLMVVWEGEAQKVGHGGGTLVDSRESCPLATASPPLA